MRKVLTLLAITTAFAAPAMAQSPAPSAGQAAPAYKYQTPQLHRAAIDALLADPSHVLFIDLRRPDEVSAIGTFPVYLSVQIKDLEKELGFIPKERPIVTVSNHANRAGQAGDILTKNGFKVVGAVGSQLYEAEGGTIVKIAIPQRQATAATPAAPKP
ncbi:MAG: rhodanese-like domain-containing protein [Beijerinckiaceae bacterium]|nr:rhodanese-like domain-containing protein [Beijerinckiaceae bacterium]